MQNDIINQLVSVVIPVYNAEKTIEKCLNSVLSQTYKNIEIIIVDDGSVDNSPILLQQFKTLHPTNAITIIRKTNGGVSSARNAGMKVAKGDYIALLDADDTWISNKIEKQIKILFNNNSIGMIGCNSINDKVNIPRCIEKNGLITIKLKTLVYKNHFQPSTVIIKKSVVDTIGFFDETQKYAEEGNYFMRVAATFNCLLINERLINYGDGRAGFNSTGLSGNLKEMQKGELKNLYFAYKNQYINFWEYGVAVVFSILKFFRRILIVKLKLFKNA